MSCESSPRRVHVMNIEDGSPPLTCGSTFTPITVPLTEVMPKNLLVSELEQLVLKAHNMAYTAAGAPLTEIILPYLANVKLSQIPVDQVDIFISINGISLDSRRLVHQYLIANSDQPLVEYQFELRQQPSWALDPSSKLVKFRIETCATTQMIRNKIQC